MSSTKILHQHERYVIVDKPTGILMHRSPIAPDKDTLVDRLKAQFGRNVYCVHRLDRQTSGVCMITFDAEATALLQKVFARRQVEKRYVALVRGIFPDALTVERELTADDGKKKDAVTEFTCVERFTDDANGFKTSFVRAKPLTGRRHQIRRHLAHSMHHIVGDTTYGKGGINRDFRTRFDLHRLFLHAEALRFACPYTDRDLEVVSPLPEELTSVLGKLRALRGLS